MSYPLVNRRGKTMTWWAFNTYDPVAKRLNFGEYKLLRDKFLVPYINPPKEIKNNESQNEALHDNAMLFFIEGAIIVGPWTINNGDHQVITQKGGN